MRRFTLADLAAILTECADLPPGLVLDDPETPLANLDIDSMAVLALQIALEERYGVTLTEEALPHLLSLGSTVEYVNHVLRAQA